jgi:hypothetical protein
MNVTVFRLFVKTSSKMGTRSTWDTVRPAGLRQFNAVDTGRSDLKVSQKVKGFFILKKHIYCKYTERKLILLFNVIPPPPDFSAPVLAFHIPSEKKDFWLCL